MTDPLNRKMFLKGGLLMGLAYRSPRLSMDIDLTTTLETTSQTPEKLREKLNQGFPKAVAILGYTDMIVQIHSIKQYPRKMTISTATFPALKLKITSAKCNTHQEITLQRGKTSNVIIEMDISFNEPLLEQIQIIKLTNEYELLAYGLVDLVAEKYRAVLQQIPCRRRRPQDIYDLNRLIQHEMIDDDSNARILDAIREKVDLVELNQNKILWMIQKSSADAKQDGTH
ncbi:MAG: nucleotidyl transferase AbiEii/AbiGii toxin family protein [Bacteroidetes bacterium]|nr:nucleotidyl transferase AbiEii/AbiGii toxin family protein [Bacteroidota bacterium]